MIEVERKLPADHEPLERRLAEIGAEQLGTVRQADTYFDAPDRSFETTDEALRIRRIRTDEGQSARLTYKGPRIDAGAKSRTEHETGVDDPEELEAILLGLEYDPVATVSKRRKRFAVGNCVVSLDAVEGVGTYVEIEYQPFGDSAVPGEEKTAHSQALADAGEAIEAVCRKLDLDPDEHVSTSYLGLLLAESDGSG